MSAHGKPRRNEDIAHCILVLGEAPSVVAEAEGLSMSRINQIVTQYGMQVLGVPPGFQRPIRVLREYVQRNCIKDGRLVPCPRG